MNPSKARVSAKDLFLNLGAFVALYTVVISLINLLFTVINKAYPQVTNNYYGYNSFSNISWPVSVIIIFFPILIALMWLLEKQYVLEPERQRTGVHKWLSFVTLFVSGLAFAGDLITVLYYFLNGEELTVGFLLKVLVVLVISASLFVYYITDIRGKLTSSSRKVWRILSAVIIIGSIVWGFSVLGSPRTQRLYKYDEAKINDLLNITSSIENYYYQNPKNALPNTLADLSSVNYVVVTVDSQTQKPYEYTKTGPMSYKICADFNTDSKGENFDGTRPTVVGLSPDQSNWSHPKGNHCFDRSVTPQYGKPVPIY
ncbi:MAG: DUF5671 domain-containing protein [Minisyncoccia bacterium]